MSKKIETKITKSAKTGKIVSKEFADKNPDTTFEQTVKKDTKTAKPEPGPMPIPTPSPGPMPIPVPTPKSGDVFDYNGQTIVVMPDSSLAVRTVVDHVTSDTPTDVSLSECTPISRGEYFRRLG